MTTSPPDGLAALGALFLALAVTALLGAALARPLAWLFPAADPSVLWRLLAIAFTAGPGVPLIVVFLLQTGLFDDLDESERTTTTRRSAYGASSFVRASREAAVCSAPRNGGKRVLVRSITSRRRKAALALPVGYGPIDVDVDGVAWRAGWPAARLRSRRDRGRGQAPGRLGRHPPARRLIRTAAASRPKPPGALPVTGGAGGPAAQSARR